MLTRPRSEYYPRSGWESLTSSRMLYDFHNQQNAKKPGTIHATYLLSGTKRRETPVITNRGIKQDGEDEYMQSSPFMSSSLPQPEEDTGESSVLTISLVREEELESNDIFPQEVGLVLTFHQRSTLPVRTHYLDTYLQSRAQSVESMVFAPKLVLKLTRHRISKSWQM